MADWKMCTDGAWFSTTFCRHSGEAAVDVVVVRSIRMNWYGSDLRHVAMLQSQ